MCGLLGDLVRALARGVLGRLHFLASLAAEDADEATHCVGLPARGRHNLGQRRSLRAPHHGENFGLLVGALSFGFTGRLLRLARFLRGRGFLCGGALALRPPERLYLAFSQYRLCSCSSVFLLDRVAVVTSGSEKLQPESLVIRPGTEAFALGRTETSSWVPFLCTRQNVVRALGTLLERNLRRTYLRIRPI